MEKSVDILLCYRGRFKNYVSALAEELRRRGMRVTYDREILADPSAYDEHTQVDWFTLGGTPQTDIGWRAPLHEAIDSAEMVAFALDMRDQSENVTNEIRWTVQCSAHTFFLIHEGPQTLEAQGVIVGLLGTQYILTTGLPEYPEFGYHFCGDLGGDNLQKDVVIAANRIVDHLKRCREGKLRELTADNDVTLSDLEHTPLVQGRKFLSRLQEVALGGSVNQDASPTKSAFDEARQYLEQREVEAARGPQTDRQLDQFRRAEEILERSRPGPYEVSNDMGPFALQAASIEAIIHDDLRKVQPTPDFRPAIIIGTIIYSNLAEPWIVLSISGCKVLVIDAMFVDFLYQLIKVSMSASKVTLHHQDDHAMVELDFAAVSDQIRSQPELSDGLFRSVRRYIAEGRPDSSTTSPPGVEIQEALGTYIQMAERYLVALGYSQITLGGSDWPMPVLNLDFDPAKATPEQMQFLRDLVPLDYCVRGRSFIDQSDPLHAVVGCCFTMSAIYLRRRMLLTMDPGSRKWASEDIASFSGRLQRLLQYVHRQMIKGGASPDFADRALNNAWLTGITPLKLWEAIEPRLQAEQQRGLKALPLWWTETKTSSPAPPPADAASAAAPK
ncbi:MAG: hypothetical protein WAM71_19210 [Candidatus Korobacteraceae bacterium]